MTARILLVEDNEATVEVVQKELEVLGYEVSVARNGTQAVEKAAAELPDLIVMDVLMPQMDGLEAASRIKQVAKTSGIPILAATAMAVSGDREKCLASGCNGYITKPFTHRDLDRAIKALLKIE